MRKRLFLSILGILLVTLTANLHAQTVQVSVPDTSLPAGKILNLPVRVNDLSGLGVYSFDLTLLFDSSVLTALKAYSEGTLSAIWGPPTYNTSTPGQIQVGMGGTDPLSGQGVLIYLQFRVNENAAIGTTSPLTFLNFMFNEGSPSATVSGGTFTVIADTQPPIITSGPQAQSITSHSVHIRWTTDEPSDSRVEYGTTTAYGQEVSDASFVTEHDLVIHGLQASTTYHYRVSSTDPLGNGPTVSEDFTFTTADIILRLPSLSGDPGEDVEVPVQITDVSEQGVTSVDLTIQFGADILSPIGVSTEGTLASAWSAPTFSTAPGEISLHLAGDPPLSGSGTLVKVLFHVPSDAAIGASCPLDFTQAQLNSGQVPVVPQSGQFTVLDTRPPEITLGPRVTILSSRTVRIEWMTNERATSIVEFGTDVSYGQVRRSDERVMEHQVLLSGLEPNTEYHYRVGSVDSSGNGPTYSADQTFTTPAGAGIQVWVPDTTATAGAEGMLPVYVGEVTGQAILSWSFVLAYDSQLLTPLRLETGGSLSEGWPAPQFQVVDGQITASARGSTPLSGAGKLIQIVFRVPDNIPDGEVSPLQFLDFQFNEGQPEASPQSGSVTIQGVPDTQPPQITFGPYVDRITTDSAVITWFTDEEADSWVEYGPTESYGQREGRGDFVTRHEVTLTGLDPGQTYHFRVASTDPHGNGPTTSSDATFQTNTTEGVSVTLPSVSQRAGTEFTLPIQIGNVTGKEVYSADIIVAFDPTVLTALSASTQGTLASSWGDPVYTLFADKIIIAMGGIDPLQGSGTLVTIRFRVSDQAQAGDFSPLTFRKFVFNEGTPEAVIHNGLFTVRDVSGPVITSGPIVSQVSSQSATILWTTDEPATSIVEYGLTPAYGFRDENTQLVTNHIVRLVGLTPGSTYHFRVGSADAQGNGPTFSDDQQFQTLSETLVHLQAPHVAFDAGDRFDLEITIGNLGDRQIVTVDFTLYFSKEFLIAEGISTEGTLTEGWNPPQYTLQEDRVTLHLSGSTPLSGSGTLVKIRFLVRDVGAYGVQTPLRFSDAKINNLITGVTTENGSFTLVDRRAPIITTGPIASEVTSNSAEIVWTTNEPADSYVEYGPTTSYGQSQSDSQMVLQHRIRLTGLAASTLYHFRVASWDTAGNGPTWSGDYTLITTSGHEVSVTIPDTSLVLGSSLLYPIRVADLTGQNVLSYSFTLAFDSTALEALGVERQNTLSSGWGDPEVIFGTGELTVSHSGTSALQGSGTLIYLRLKGKEEAPPGLRVLLFFKAFQFNQGDPPAVMGTALCRLLPSSSVTVSIPDSSAPPGQTFSMAVRVSTVTGFDIRSFEFTLSFDPNLLSPLGANPEGSLSAAWGAPSFSVSDTTLTVSASGSQPLEGEGVLIWLVWRVSGGAIPGTTTSLNFTSFVFDGGFPPVQTQPGVFTVATGGGGGIQVTLPDTAVLPGTQFFLPVQVSDLTGQGVFSFQFVLQFDPSLLSFVHAESQGTLSEIWGEPQTSSSQDTVRVSMQGTSALEGEGVLILLQFASSSQAHQGDSSPLHFVQFLLNRGNPSASTRDGIVRIFELRTSISGRVLESDSVTAVEGAWVKAIASGTGAVYQTLTDSSGFYQLEDLDTAQVYTVSAGKAGYSSPPPFQNVAPGTSNLNFYLMKNDGVIDGWVRDDKAKPVQGALIVVDDQHGHFGSDNSDSTGYFRIANLARTNPYTLNVTKFGFFQTTLTDIRPDTTLYIQLRWIYGRIRGWVYSQDSVGVEGVKIQAMSLSRGVMVDSFVTESDGHYLLDSLVTDNYLVTPLKPGYVSYPYQRTLYLAPGQELEANFRMKQARLASIEISGDRRIPNNRPSLFSYTARSDSGETMLLISPIWELRPQEAGVASNGTVYPNPHYIGDALLRITDQYTGISDTLGLSIYAPVTPADSISLMDDTGFRLAIPQGALSGPVDVFLDKEDPPAVKRSTRDVILAGKGYWLKPSGIRFQIPVQLTLPIPEGYDPGSAVIGRWDMDHARWQILPNSRVEDRTVQVQISEFSLFGVLIPSQPLGVRQVHFRPNPFSPEVDTDGDGHPGLAIDFVVSSRDSRRPFVTIRIYNILGQLVKELLSRHPEEKDRRITVYWDGLTRDGRIARNGRYVVEILVEDSQGRESYAGSVVLIK